MTTGRELLDVNAARNETGRAGRDAGAPSSRGDHELDFAPLSATPSQEDLAALRAAVTDGRYGRASRERYGKKDRGGLMVFAFIGGFLGLIFAIMALVALVRGDSEDALIGLFFTGGVALIGLLCGWAASRSDKRHWAGIWQLVTFAEANGLEVQPAAKVVLLPGSIFTTKAHASTGERVSWTVGGRAVEVAHHHRSGGGSVPNSFQARYLAVHLGQVPDLTFTAGTSRGAARPGLVAGPEVVLTGSGGGRRRGTLASRPGAAEATRAFMTDELVDLLTDPDHPCNAEATGGWFFVYFPPEPRPDAARWRHLFALADAVVRAADLGSPSSRRHVEG